ncbi:MAG: cupin domain-containing protein, partial [Silicimonas sp.]|nr:cupin domain-containing protein [Silicimonas sp.]
MKILPAVSLLAICAAPALAHEPFPWHGSEIHVLLDKEGTGGEMGMFTSTFAGPGGPPLHVHEDAGEAFYLLEGSAELVSGDQRFTLQAGEVAYVPKGLDHTFHMIEEAGGKILVIVAPGGFEGFFSATKDLKMPDDIDKMNAISAEFGQV